MLSDMDDTATEYPSQQTMDERRYVESIRVWTQTIVSRHDDRDSFVRIAVNETKTTRK